MSGEVSLTGGSGRSGYNLYNLDPGDVYSSGVYVPRGRQMADGSHPIIADRIRAYVGGYGASRSFRLQLGSSDTSAFTMGSGAGQDTGWRGIWQGFHNGGSTTVRVHGSEAYYVNRGNPGNGSTRKARDGYTWNSGITGEYHWIEGPSQPRNVSASSSGVGSAAVSWSGPADNGGSAITDYRVEWATNSSFTSGFGSKYVGGTSTTITGLPATTLYFRVAARNAVTNWASTWSPYSGTVSEQLASAPAAVPGVALTPGPDLLHVVWGTPSNGGAPITSYDVQIDDNNSFTSPATYTFDDAIHAKTFIDQVPSSVQYVRVRAKNAAGTGAWSSTVSAGIPARGVLDGIGLAATHVLGGYQVELRSNGAVSPTLSLVWSSVTGGTAVNTITTLPLGSAAGSFHFSAAIDGLALCSDPIGNIYVVGAEGINTNRILVRRYARTAETTWVASGALSQELPQTGEPLMQFSADWVKGVGQTGFDSLLILARRAGATGGGNLVFATARVNSVVASSGTLFTQAGTDPGWLSKPGTAGVPNGSRVDVTTLSEGGQRVALGANGFAVVDVNNGVVSGVSKSPDSTVLDTDKFRIVPINGSTFVSVWESNNALGVRFRNTAGAELGYVEIPTSYVYNLSFGDKWDAYFDRRAGVLSVEYVADDSARKVEKVQISPATFTLFTPSVVTTTFGAVGGVASRLRLPQGLVDERKVLLTGDSNASGTRSLGSVADTSGNVAPTAPSLNTQPTFDATTAQTLRWSFGDPNTADTQSAYEVEIYRTDTGVLVLDTGQIASTVSQHVLAANALPQNVNYRWQVRTWDALGVVGSFSAYSQFKTSHKGTVAVTVPASDNPVSDLNYQDITWVYSNTGSATQNRYRVQVFDAATDSLMTDFGWQAGTETSFRVTNLQSDVEQRIEVQVENTDGLLSTIGTRLVTPSFGLPMTPEFVLSVGPGFLRVDVTNPTPSGSRPEVIINEIWKRPHGVGDYYRVGTVPRNGTYRDYSVKSNGEYDFFVRGVSEEVI